MRKHDKSMCTLGFPGEARTQEILTKCGNKPEQRVIYGGDGASADAVGRGFRGLCRHPGMFCIWKEVWGAPVCAPVKGHPMDCACHWTYFTSKGIKKVSWALVYAQLMSCILEYLGNSVLMTTTYFSEMHQNKYI